jgi:phosphoglycolate phosphatase
MKKTPVRALILDFDGTMATPSTLDIAGINQHLSGSLRRQGLTWPEQGYLLERTQMLKNSLPPHWSEEKIGKLIQEIKDHIMLREMEAAQDSRLFSFTSRVLAQAEAMGLRLAIASRNCRPAILSVFPQAGAYVLLSRETVEQVKPHPHHFREAARLMEVDIKNCAAAGDHIMDMEAARASGCLGVGVLSGLSQAQDLLDRGAEIIIDDLSRLLPALTEKGYLSTHSLPV